MGIFEFFKKLVKEEVIETEKVRLEDIEFWILNNEKEIEKDKKEFLEILKEKVKEFVKKFDEKINNLKNINIDQRKEEERIKFVVKENFEKYVEDLKEFKTNLENITANEPEDFIKKIEQTFENLHKRASAHFNKASFLIGKDLGVVQDAIGIFGKDIKKISEEKSHLTNKSKILKSITEKLRESNDIKKYKEGVNSKIKNIQEEIKNTYNEIENTTNKVREIKESEEYIQMIKIKQENQNKIDKLNTELSNFKQMLDFKKLGEIFHVSENDMAIIKSHKENFKENFLKDNGEKIISLLNEIKLDNEEVKKKYKEILKLKKQTDGFVSGLNQVDEKYKEIEKLKSKINNFENEKISEEKRFKKFDSNKNEIKEFIREEMKGIGVEVI